MKKFLSVLLALAVAFTFTFGSTMSAFADTTTYTVDEFNSALTSAETAQLGYLANAKTQVVNSLAYDKEGYADIDGIAYKVSKPAVEAAAQAVIDGIDTAMKAEIKSQLEAITEFPTTTAPNTAKVAACSTKGSNDCLTKAGLLAELKTVKNVDNEFVLSATEEPLTKAYVEGKLAVDTSKYNSEKRTLKADGTAGTDLTAAEYVTLLVTNAKKAVADAAANKATSAADKIAAYRTALSTFESNLAPVKTLEQEAADDAQNAKDVDAAAKAFVAAGLNAKYYNVAAVPAADKTVDLTTAVTNDYAAVYVEKTATKNATVFGVEVKDITKVTAAEMTAINNAAYKAINDAEAILVKGLNAGESKTIAEYDTKAKYIGVLAKTIAAADKYAEVVKAGDALKATYSAGVKLYDDAKVDAAVKAAEALVYEDAVVKGAFTKTAQEYIDAAAKAENIDYRATTSEKARIDAAKKAAKAKFIDAPVLYGENKTSDADLVYVKNTYAASASDKYEEIKDDATDAINDAESVAEVEAALAAAKAELAKLLLAKNAEEVGKAIDTAKKDLEAYASYKTATIDTAKTYTLGQVAAAKTAGIKLIEEAITVDGVNAALAEAKTLIDGIKTDDEIKAAKKAIEDQIAALPLNAKITAADYDAIKAVVDAVIEYNKIPGSASAPIDTTVLEAKFQTAINAKAKAIEEKATALKKNLAAVSSGSDADLAAFVGYKPEAVAITDELNALTDDIKAINEDIRGFATNPTTTDAEYIKYLVETKIEYDQEGAVTFYEKEVALCSALVMKAYKSDATKEDCEAAIAAYEKLTDLQKTYYETYDQGYNKVGIIKDKLASMGWTATDVKASLFDSSRKLTIWRTSKTSIRVTSVGSVADIKDHGYTVEYKFYKKAPGATSYKLVKTTSSNKYTYTNLKKGTNKFQVKVVVKDADGKVVASKWTYYRAAKIK